MQRQPMIDVILCEGPCPTPRERQISWLQFCFAAMFAIPVENVSVVHNDDQEAVTVHLTCTNACRCVMTLTHWCTSDDEFYTFVLDPFTSILLPFEPQAGEL